MNRLVAFLENCGANAALLSMDKADLLLAARQAGLDEDQVAAVARLDRDQLEGMLSARTKMACCVFPARDPEPGQDDPGDEEAPSEPKEPSENRLAA